MADHRPRCWIACGPTTPHHAGTRRLACAVALLARDQSAWREPPPSRIAAAGRARPRRPRARGRAARVGPARLRQRWLQARPIACPLAQHHPLRPRGDEPAEACDQGEMALCGTGPWRGGAHPPGQRQGAAFRDARAHESGAPTAPTAPLHAEHHCLPGELTEEDVCRGQKGHLLQAVGVVSPPRKACDTACGLGAVGPWRSARRPWRVCAAHEAAEERCKGAQVPGDWA
jgi:hypothetical protein